MVSAYHSIKTQKRNITILAGVTGMQSDEKNPI
jgi:hypothetical protein